MSDKRSELQKEINEFFGHLKDILESQKAKAEASGPPDEEKDKIDGEKVDARALEIIKGGEYLILSKDRGGVELCRRNLGAFETLGLLTLALDRVKGRFSE